MVCHRDEEVVIKRGFKESLWRVQIDNPNFMNLSSE